MSTRKNKVNVFFVGAAKSSTTTLYKTMESCDKILLPIVKEPNYFSKGSANIPGKGPGDKYATEVLLNLEEYEANYPKNSDAQIICDFSVSYLYDDRAPSLIKDYNPDAKIIAILRNPVERAWSHYLHLKRDCRETESFSEALKHEELRIKEGFEFSWHYSRMGMYHDQLIRYGNLFGSNFKVFIFEEIMKDQRTFFQELARFINIPELENLRFSNEKYNQTGSIKHPIIASIVNRPSRIRSIIRSLVPRRAGSFIMEKIRKKTMDDTKPVMDESVECELYGQYLSDIEAVEKLLNFNLSSWKREK